MKDYLITSIVYMNKYNGLKESRVNNDNITLLSFKKNSIYEINDYELLKLPGIYFLIYEDYDDGKNYIYIGQANDVSNRITQHVREDVKIFKDIYAFVNKNGDLSKTYIDFLEWHYIQKIKEQNIYVYQNKDERKNKPKINHQEQILVDEYIEKIDQLLAFCGINFEKVNLSSKNNQMNIYYFMCAKMLYNNGDFFLLKDSEINNNKIDLSGLSGSDLNSYRRILNFREANKGLLEEKGDKLVLLDDIKVNSCSLAACIVKGYKALNGWDVWKNKENKTLDQVLRKSIEDK